MAVLTLAHYKAALKKHGGLLVPAADELGITRQAIYQRINNSEELQDFLATIEQGMLDKAEKVVQVSIEDDDVQTARWYLERKGKARGFGTKTEIDLSAEAIEALLASFGGDLSALRSLRDAIDPKDQEEPPEGS